MLDGFSDIALTMGVQQAPWVFSRQLPTRRPGISSSYWEPEQAPVEVCTHGWVNCEGRELAIHGGRLQAGVPICQEAILAGVILVRLTCTAAHPHNNAGSA